MLQLRVLVLLVPLVLLACAKKEALDASSSATSTTGVQGGSGSMLAYAHELHFEVPPESMAQRIEAVQEACIAEKFGACSVLNIEQSSGDHAQASINLRIVPAGVEPLITLIGEGSKILSRSTSAEDLAEQVADVAAEQDMLQRQREILQGYATRPDLALNDMITLSQQLATIESRLHELSQSSANQRRRIETNRLHLALQSNVPYSYRPEFSFGNAWDNFIDGLTEGVEETLGYAGYLIPLLLLVLPLALLWRWIWRWATRVK